MKPFATRFIVLAAASLSLPLCAHAQLFRAYVASYGNDANPCTVGAPCRLLPAAIAAVNSGGEIWMLDSANFNASTVTIPKNLIIQAIPGQVGSIVPVGGVPAMSMNPGVSLVLRNVAIVTNANNPGTHGIQMSTGRLSVEGSVFQVTYATAIMINGAGAVSVQDSTFRAGDYGIFAAEGASVNVSGCKFTGFASGAIYATSTTAAATNVVVRNSDFANNTFVGVWSHADTNASAAVTVTIASSSFSGNTYAAVSTMDYGGVSSMSVGGSVFGGNTYALYQRGTGAVMETLGNNVIRNNATPFVGTITTVSTM
jgi:hypothetical protein